MRSLHAAFLAATLLVPVTAAAADEANTPDRFAVAAGASTLGVTVQPAARVSDQLVLRLSGNYLAYSDSRNIDGISYDADLSLLSGGVIADWHPFENGLRVSAGVFYNANQMDIVAHGTVDVGGTTYTNARLDGRIDVNPVSPYVGVGYDAALFNDSGWSFWAEAGALYHGSPDVALSDRSGMIPAADLERERRAIETELDIPVHPVVGLGLRYRF